MHQGYEEEEVKDTTITRFKMRILGLKATSALRFSQRICTNTMCRWMDMRHSAAHLDYEKCISRGIRTAENFFACWYWGNMTRDVLSQIYWYENVVYIWRRETLLLYI